MLREITIICAASTCALAGPLAPPAGPIGPSYKTLDDAEPRTPLRNDPLGVPVTISEPGSYYLAENIIAGLNQSGISIDASDVSLDLNGFTIDGAGDSLGHGISIIGSRENVSISNGVIRGFLLDGISGTNSRNGVIDRVRLISMETAGIRVGTNWQIRECVARSNVEAGILVGADSAVLDCIVTLTDGDGIDTGADCLVSRCVSTQNVNTGFSTSNGVVLADCTAGANGGRGFSLGYTCTITGCVARGNGGNGIHSSATSVVADCVATNNGGDGIYVDNGLVRGCVARNNAGTNINGASTLIENH